MPELPEVETIRRGIAPYLEGNHILTLQVRERRLHWPIPEGLEDIVKGTNIVTVERRAKYLLLRLDHGTLILHLGMSGSLRILTQVTPPQPHDHFDLILTSGHCLRFRDPRRFGALLWHQGLPATHPLLCNLGPEPLTPEFDGVALAKAANHKRIVIKSLIMDGHIVAGVGNIYASEALFIAGIHPQTSCKLLTLANYDILAQAIKQVLTQALQHGGTTLRDFSQADGKPGYFANSLQVYGREGSPCYNCSNPIHMLRIGQRASFFCPHCQT